VSDNGKTKGLVSKGSGGGKPRGVGGGKSFGDITFIAVNLTDAEKLVAEKWIKNGVDLQQALEGVLSSEYKLGLTYDVRNGAYICSITDRREDSKFFAYCYSLRARDPITAFLRVAWLHAVHLEGDWEGLVASSTRPADW